LIIIVQRYQRQEFFS